MEQITLESQLTLRDYTILVINQTLKKPIIIFLFIIGIPMIVSTILYYLDLFPYYSSPPIFPLFMGIFILLLPVITCFQARRHYRTNKRLSELMAYEISNDQIHVQGESFNSTYNWEKINRIEINKKWILIYHSNATANIIRRKDFMKNEVTKLIELVNSKKELKKKIKN
jgi:hypothetical protein